MCIKCYEAWKKLVLVLQMKSLLLHWGLFSVKKVFFSLFPAVSKNKVVQLCIVRCQASQPSLKPGSKESHTMRSSIQECYRRTEVWPLHDLILVDGRDPDVVISIAIALQYYIAFFRKDWNLKRMNVCFS